MSPQGIVNILFDRSSHCNGFPVSLLYVFTAKLFPQYFFIHGMVSVTKIWITSGSFPVVCTLLSICYARDAYCYWYRLSDYKYSREYVYLTIYPLSFCVSMPFYFCFDYLFILRSRFVSISKAKTHNFSAGFK